MAKFLADVSEGLQVNVVEDPIQNAVFKNPWRNVYWFSRMLINGDKYGAVGKESEFLLQLAASLSVVVADQSQTDELKIELSKGVFERFVQKRFSRATGKSARVKLFFDDLANKLQTVDDIKVFVCAATSILVPINVALTTIPSNDREFTEDIAKTYLDKLGDSGLATVVGFWDDAGVEGCLNAERAAVLRSFTHLRRDLAHMPELELNLVLTAFVQEFERRLGQKRKGRAGGSLEDVASFLFGYYGVKADNKPDHFQADIEVDKWVRCRDKWLIAISCKRTLRERWKQVSAASSEVLSKHKIKQIWHLVTYDEDLSDDKLALLGGQRHIFYLRDESRKLAEFSKHIGLKSYVRPMSSFIVDLKKEIG
jgi:hypothetical protein